MIAKNGGLYKVHHFAHENGVVCDGYTSAIISILYPFEEGNKSNKSKQSNKLHQFHNNKDVFHSFKVGDVVKHICAPNELFFIDTVSSVGYQCFWFVNDEPDCDRRICFIFEDESFLEKVSDDCL